MKRNKLIVIAVLISLLAISVMGVQAQDATADNPPLLTMPRLLDGEPIEDFVNTQFPFQLYRITGNEGDVVSISLEAVSEDLDTVLVLLGPAGGIVAFDDDGGEGLNSAITEVTLEAQGSYFVIASSFSALNGGGIDAEGNLDYVISMTGATGVLATDASEGPTTGKGDTTTGRSDATTTDDTATTDDATTTDDASAEEGDPASIDYPFFRGLIEFDVPFEGYSNGEEPVYYVLFNGTEGQTITAEMTSEEIDTFLYLVAPGGVGIALSDDDAELGGTNSAVRDIALPVDGIYMFMATTYGYYSLTPEFADDFPGGSFSLSLIESQPSSSSK
jgi:hypothetical protein